VAFLEAAVRFKELIADFHEGRPRSRFGSAIKRSARESKQADAPPGDSRWVREVNALRAMLFDCNGCAGYNTCARERRLSAPLFLKILDAGDLLCPILRQVGPGMRIRTFPLQRLQRSASPVFDRTPISRKPAICC
jgi:hypothetical protein